MERDQSRFRSMRAGPVLLTAVLLVALVACGSSGEDSQPVTLEGSPVGDSESQASPTSDPESSGSDAVADESDLPDLQLPVNMAEVCPGGDFGAGSGLSVGVYDSIPTAVQDYVADRYPDGPPANDIVSLDAAATRGDISDGWVYSDRVDAVGTDGTDPDQGRAAAVYLHDGEVIMQVTFVSYDGKWGFDSDAACSSAIEIFRPDLATQ